MNDLVNVTTLVKGTGGDPKLVLTGFALAMAMLCDRLIAHDADSEAVAAALDDMKELYEEAETRVDAMEAK